MPKDCEINFGKIFDLPNPGLRSYFDNVRLGQPDVYQTPMGKKYGVQELLQEWMAQLEPLSNSWPTLLEFEKDLAKKVGPMSVMKPLAERMDDIESYYESVLPDSEPLDHSAIAAVMKEWGSIRGLHPRGQRSVVEKMKLSTNSGSPYFKKRRNMLAKTVPVNLLGSNGSVQDLPSGTWINAAVLGWRGQEGGPSPQDVKQRVVWMFPFGVNICELQVYQPLIEAAQNFNLVPAWVSMEAVDLGITRMFDTKGHDDLIICTDFTKFDQHFNRSLQMGASQLLTSILDHSYESRQWIEQVFPVKYTIPLAYDFGKVREGNHGMGSGSGGTNADETLVHRALQYESAIRVGKRLNPNSQCLGDDGILTYPGITEKDVMLAYTRHGLEMNAAKQYASKQDCTYLRRWHHREYRMGGVCVGVYSTCRALGRLCEQERYYDPEIWGPTMVALRQLSILENVKYHPLRDQFVKFCMRRDKYRLGLDIPGFLDNVQRIAEEAIDIMPDFMGYTQSLDQSKYGASGITNWWIVRYLKSMQ